MLKGLAAEKVVREKLGKLIRRDFLKKREERTLVVGRRSNGEEIKHEFDLVSDDKSIVGEVKSDKYTEKHHANTRLPRILGACRFLELIKAERKILVLTNKTMHQKIRSDLDGLIKSDIEIIHMNIDNDV
jgi:hypothetical protein